MNTSIPMLLKRTALVLGLLGALLQAEDSFAQKKKKKGKEAPTTTAPAVRPASSGPANGPKP